MKLRIGVIGLDWDRGIPLALAMRDYGGHSVIGYGADIPYRDITDDPTTHPETEVKHQLGMWALPVTDRIELFAEYCDLVFIAAHPNLWTPLWHLAAQPRPSHLALPVVVVYPCTGAEMRPAWARCQPNLDLGYSPIWGSRENALARLSNPQHPIRVAGSEQLHKTVERAWRYVRNTIPVIRHVLTDWGVTNLNLATGGDLQRGTGEGSPVASDGLETPPAGVDNPRL